MHKRHFYSCALIAAALALLSTGCAGPIKNMREVPEERATFAPDQGKAMVVFMRPAWVGGGIQSSVFQIVRDTPKLVGIVVQN